MGVDYLVSDRVARIVLNRPDAGNALDLGTTQALRDAVVRGSKDPFADVIVLTATGDVFCSGSDTSAAEGSSDPASALFELAAALDELFGALDAATKPVLVGVAGLAAGSGLGLALAADLVLCTATATFRADRDQGLAAPDAGVAWLLPRAVGQHRAMSLALTRRTLDAATAEAWGIATLVTEDLDAALRSTAETLLGPHRWASGETRRLLRASWRTSRAELAQSEAATLVRAVLTRRPG